nr:MAG TPA: hypothetical protein [Caudoviricetes sp.]
MMQYIDLNKEYCSNLTTRFLKELADNIRPILQKEDLFLLNLDIIGIQVNRIVYNSSANDFYFYLDFIEQKFGICQEVILCITFCRDKVNFISLSVPKKELSEEFKAVLPLLEKYLVNQLYILKRVIEETEEN